MATTHINYGVIRRGKLVKRDKPIYSPLRKDGPNGIGELARSALGGLRRSTTLTGAMQRYR